MARPSWLGLLLVLSVVLGVGLAVSCAKSGDDDDNDASDDAGDDAGDDTSGCSVEQLCTFEVETCHFPQWTDLNDCETTVPEYIQTHCADHVNQEYACVCDCLAVGPTCANYVPCSTSCWNQFCS